MSLSGTIPSVSAARRLTLLVVMLVTALATWPAITQAADGDVYVSPSGADSAAGSQNAPVATIGRALALAQPDSTVWVAPGTYPGFTDMTTRVASVTIQGLDGRPTIADKITLAGSSGVTLRGLDVHAQVLMTNDVYAHVRPTTDVTLDDLEISAPDTVCVAIRSGTQHVVIEHTYIHDCATGILGPHSTPSSSDVTIRDNRLERFSADALQFADWDDVEIAGNLLRDISDPAGLIHNDALQFVGNSTGVRIHDNELANSAGQLLLIQDAVGPVDDVEVTNNLIHDAAGYAVQQQGATHVTFRRNTVWHSHWGGLLVRTGQRTLPDGSHTVPTDTVVTDNILSGLGTDGAAQISDSTNNVIACSTDGGGTCASDATFQDVTSSDYRVRSVNAFAGTVGWAPPGSWYSPGPGLDELGGDTENPPPPPSTRIPSPTPSSPVPSEPRSAPVAALVAEAPTPTSTADSATPLRASTTAPRAASSSTHRTAHVATRKASKRRCKKRRHRHRCAAKSSHGRKSRSKCDHTKGHARSQCKRSRGKREHPLAHSHRKHSNARSRHDRSYARHERSRSAKRGRHGGASTDARPIAHARRSPGSA